MATYDYLALSFLLVHFSGWVLYRVWVQKWEFLKQNSHFFYQINIIFTRICRKTLYCKKQINIEAMNELQIIQNKIYEIRGQKVMLDRDLAEMYGVETRALNQAVKRNAERFPEDFMFQLTIHEWNDLKSQIVTSSWGGVRKLPNVFTELGVAMLSSVLASKTAIQINMGIMRAFVTIRQMITDNSPLSRLSTLEKNFNELKQDLEEIFADYNDINEDTRAQIEAINTTLAELQAKPADKPRRAVGFIKPTE